MESFLGKVNENKGGRFGLAGVEVKEVIYINPSISLVFSCGCIHVLP